MSIRIMLRKCEHCGHRYPYNPSVGNFGMICPKCHRTQKEIFTTKTPIHYRNVTTVPVGVWKLADLIEKHINKKSKK